MIRQPSSLMTTLPFVLLISGLLLRAFLSEPFVMWMGIDYASIDSGTPWEKIHISAYLVVIAFLVMIMRGGIPIENLTNLAHRHVSAFSMLTITILATIFWAIRDPSGIGLMLDTHLPACLAIIAMTQCSSQQKRQIIWLFIGFGLCNAVIGIVEGIAQARLMPHPDMWGVAHDPHFRASAFLGHPLNNALFTGVLLLITQDTIKSMLWRSLSTLILIAALVAFGGRAAIVLSCAAYGIGYVLAPQHQTAMPPPHTGVVRMLLRPILPVALMAFLALLLLSPLGERLMAFADGHDASAQSRITAFHIFDYIDTVDIWVGMSVAQLDEAREKLSDQYAMSDIENPWLLMLLMLGVVLFPLWGIAFISLLCWIWQNSALHTLLALVTYLLAVSTSNGFGRKDGILSLVLVLLMAQCDPTRRQNKTIPRQPWPEFLASR